MLALSYAESRLLGCTADAHKTEPITHRTPSAGSCKTLIMGSKEILER